jgi:hypothetical protein
MAKAVALSQRHLQIELPLDVTGFQRYAASAGDNLFGDLLRFSGKDGMYTSGSQGHELPEKTQLVALIGQTLAGLAA